MVNLIIRSLKGYVKMVNMMTIVKVMNKKTFKVTTREFESPYLAQKHISFMKTKKDEYVIIAIMYY